MALRNYVQRRNHKERGQLASRRHLGLLEKKKDYKLRAEDHHAKQRALSRLAERAANKNADEFSFSMIKGRVDTKTGQHVLGVSKEEANLSHALISLLKTQDAAALRDSLRRENKRVAKLTDKLGPLVPSMRVAWLHETVPGDFQHRTRGQVLQLAHLLAGEGGWDPLDGDDDDEVGSDARVGDMGKKTVWCDSVDELRTITSKGKGKGKAQTEAVAAESDEVIDAEALDRDDDLSPSDVPGRRGEKYTAYLVSLLSGRQARVAVLESALGKLELVRKMMRTKGQHVKLLTRKDAEQHDQLTDLVADGKVTPFGIALPGYEDEQAKADTEDYRDSFGFNQRGFKGTPAPKKKSYKWSTERQR